MSCPAKIIELTYVINQKPRQQVRLLDERRHYDDRSIPQRRMKFQSTTQSLTPHTTPPTPPFSVLSSRTHVIIGYFFARTSFATHDLHTMHTVRVLPIAVYECEGRGAGSRGGGSREGGSGQTVKGPGGIKYSTIDRAEGKTGFDDGGQKGEGGKLVMIKYARSIFL